MKTSVYITGIIASCLVGCKSKESGASAPNSDTVGVIDTVQSFSSKASFHSCSADTNVYTVFDVPFVLERSVDSFLDNVKARYPQVGAVIESKDGGAFRQFAGDGPLSSKGSVGLFLSCDAKDSGEISNLREIFDIYRCDAEDEAKVCGDSKSEFLVARAQALVDSLNLKFRSAHASIAATFYPKVGRCLDSLEYFRVEAISQELKAPIALVSERSEL